MNISYFLQEKIENGNIIFHFNENELNNIDYELNNTFDRSNLNLNKKLRKILRETLKRLLPKINDIMYETGTIKYSLELHKFDNILHPKIISKITDLNNIYGDLNEHDGIENILYDLIDRNK